MTAAPATERMRKMLADENETIQVQAAIAVYRLTGENALAQRKGEPGFAGSPSPQRVPFV
jgi:hypothetical protein